MCIYNKFWLALFAECNQSGEEWAQSEAAGGGGSAHSLWAGGACVSSPRPVSQQREVQEESLQAPQAPQTSQTPQAPKDSQSPQTPQGAKSQGWREEESKEGERVAAAYQALQLCSSRVACKRNLEQNGAAKKDKGKRDGEKFFFPVSSACWTQLLQLVAAGTLKLSVTASA